MKILHLVGLSEDHGGVLSVIRNLQTAAVEQSWNHCIWVKEGYRETRTPALDYRFSRHIVGEDHSQTKMALQSVRAFAELRELLRRERFDILHAHSRGTLLTALLVTARLRRPVVFTNHNWARRKALYSWASRRRGLFTVLLTANMARHYGLKVQRPVVSVISECCADRFFEEPLVARRTSFSVDNPLRLVGVGTIVRWKGWHLVCDAVCLLDKAERSRVEFWLWGPIPADHASREYDAEVREYVRAHGLEKRFRFMGVTDRVSECLRQGHWFVLPSTNEPCAVSLIEALALGMPAIVSAGGGNVDIVKQEETGLLFEPDSAAYLAGRIRAVLEGKASPAPPEDIRESVRHRSASRVAVEYRALYDKVRQEERSAR